MEVESVLRQHPEVNDVAAYGVPSKEIESEDELKIDLILKPDASATYQDIAQFINDSAPYYFVPRYMEFVEELPYTPTNKVQKYVLREKEITAAAWDLHSSDFEVSR